MAEWPEHPADLFNQATQRAQREDWNTARQMRTGWEDVALVTTTLTLNGDGAYRITYTGAQTLETIAGAKMTNGREFILSFDVTGAGGNLTIARTGNISLSPNTLDFIVSSDFAIMRFKMIGTTACLMSFAHP